MKELVRRYTKGSTVIQSVNALSCGNLRCTSWNRRCTLCNTYVGLELKMARRELHLWICGRAKLATNWPVQLGRTHSHLLNQKALKTRSQAKLWYPLAATAAALSQAVQSPWREDAVCARVQTDWRLCVCVNKCGRPCTDNSPSVKTPAKPVFAVRSEPIKLRKLTMNCSRSSTAAAVKCEYMLAQDTLQSYNAYFSDR